MELLWSQLRSASKHQLSLLKTISDYSGRFWKVLQKHPAALGSTYSFDLNPYVTKPWPYIPFQKNKNIKTANFCGNVTSYCNIPDANHERAGRVSQFTLGLPVMGWCFFTYKQAETLAVKLHVLLPTVPYGIKSHSGAPYARKNMRCS